MQRFLIIIGLQVYAVALALWRYGGGLLTDEAKYLLNIPYPHPPFARTIISFTESIPQQELLWRIIFATLLVQAVWLIWNAAKDLSWNDRCVLCGLWLLSGSVLFQSGAILMAVLTAVQGLVFVLLLINVERKSKLQIANSKGIFNFQFSIFNSVGWIALLWFTSLFTAYQVILYLPIVLMIFWRAKLHPLKICLVTGIPIVLTALYVASNPLAIASFTAASGQNIGQSFSDLFRITLVSWLWAGGVLSVLGLIGMLKARHWPLILSFLFVCAFHVTSYRSYYPILFLPLLIGGVLAYPSVLKRSFLLLAAQVLIVVWILSRTSFTFTESSARTVMQDVNQYPEEGIVLIHGSFGHDWQYESRYPIRKYHSSLLPDAKAVVCMEACPEIPEDNFSLLKDMSIEVWVRK